jgi:DNA-binding NarL/FixJ family response regulator
MQQIHIALLVPDRITRSGIEGLIKHGGSISYAVSSYEDFDTILCHSDSISILLMDISGLRIRLIEDRFTQLARAKSTLKVVVISNRLTAVFIHRIMQLGAKGFIYRDELADTLLNGLDLVRRDVATLSPCASQLLISSKYLYILNDIKPMDMQSLRLTARGLTVKAIATQMELSTRSIYRCRDKLREILGVQTIEILIDAAREQGLLDLEED